MSNRTHPDLRDLLAIRHYAANIKFYNEKKTSNTQSGDHLSISRGRGMDFEEVRRYQPGDDIRLIHWPLTARLGKPYTKIYKEERERAIYLVIDQSLTMQFGTRVCFKNVLAAKIAALFGWAALNYHEQVGGIIFNDKAQEFIKPKRGRESMMRLLNTMTNPHNLKHRPGGLNNALQVIYKHLQAGSTVIIISDFFSFDDATKAYLKLINHKSELINILVYDPLETSLPGGESYTFSGDDKIQLSIAATDVNRRLYAEPFQKRVTQIHQISRQFIRIATNDDIVRQINYGAFNKNGY